MTTETTSIVKPAVIGKDVSASGTAEALISTAAICNGFLVVAKAGNTGKVYIGGSNIDKTTLPANELSAGGSISFDAPRGYRFDLQDWYIDADTNGEGAWVTRYYN